MEKNIDIAGTRESSINGEKLRSQVKKEEKGEKVSNPPQTGGKDGSSHLDLRKQMQQGGRY